MSCQGKIVRIDLQSADLTTAAELGLYDEDGNAVTLQPHERLILQELGISAEQATDYVTVFSDDDDDNTVDAGERLMHVGSDTTGTAEVNTRRQFGPEGLAGALGIVPHVIAAEAGTVTVAGVGYIINGTSEGYRPSWKSSLNPDG